MRETAVNRKSRNLRQKAMNRLVLPLKRLFQPITRNEAAFNDNAALPERSAAFDNATGFGQPTRIRTATGPPAASVSASPRSSCSSSSRSSCWLCWRRAWRRAWQPSSSMTSWLPS